MGASAYTKERLEAAARGARTLSEALQRLGVDPRSSTRRYVVERMKKLGVDISHFEREGVKWTREILQEAVSASTNMCEVLRRLGLEVVGGHHTHQPAGQGVRHRRLAFPGAFTAGQDLAAPNAGEPARRAAARAGSTHPQ
ncbi:UNVERIFIED_CONTAM: hypothetical protein RKD50_003841 [Streptomyces canus]